MNRDPRRAASVQRVREYETECGPWLPTDGPQDVLYDIVMFYPDADVTIDDAAAYLVEEGLRGERQ